MKVKSFLLLILILLVYTRCRIIPPNFRPPDAVVKVKTTGYCACMTCCSWKLNPLGLPVYASGPSAGKFKIIGKTASGRMVRPGTVAVDPKVFPLGTVFDIPGYGRGRAEDTGGDIRGKHLDLFFWKHKAAAEWGTQPLTVSVWYPKESRTK